MNKYNLAVLASGLVPPYGREKTCVRIIGACRHQNLLGIQRYGLRLRKSDGKPFWRYIDSLGQCWSPDKADRLARSKADELGISCEV